MGENYNMSKAEEFLKECLKYEGFIEGINNNNPFGKYYGRNYESYCSFFVSYCAEKVGIKFFQNIKTKDGKNYLTGATNRYCGYCPSLYTFAKARGILKTDPIKQVPKAGDVILFNMNTYPDGIRWSDHVGVIVSYDPKTKIFHTIEANTSNNNKMTNDGGGVFRKQRYIKNITGWFSIV